MDDKGKKVVTLKNITDGQQLTLYGHGEFVIGKDLFLNLLTEVVTLTAAQPQRHCLSGTGTQKLT